jgi:hypothetical protein
MTQSNKTKRRSSWLFHPVCLLATITMLANDGRALAQQAEAASAESRAIDVLADGARGRVGNGVDLMLVPPPAAASPVDQDELARIMQRIALALAERLPAEIEVLPQGAGLRDTLAAIRAREGTEGWRRAVNDLVRTQADLALRGGVRLDADGAVALRLTLISLASGRVLATAPPLTIESAATPVGSPEAAIRDAVTQMLDDVPEARAEVAILPVVNARSGVATEAGKYLAEIAGAAWADAAQGITETLRDARAPSIRHDGNPGTGYRLTGRIHLVDQARFQLILTLRGPGGLRSRKWLNLATADLPPRISAALAPDERGDGPGFTPVRSLFGDPGQARLRMTLDGGANPTFRACTETEPDLLRDRCDLLRLTLAADRRGAPLCFSLGDDRAFALLVPNPVAEAPRLRADTPVTLPDALASGEVVWPARGPPSAALIGCLLYRDAAAMPRERLAGWSGTRLDTEQLRRLAAIIADSAALASAEAVVSIVAAEDGLVFRPAE